MRYTGIFAVTVSALLLTPLANGLCFSDGIPESQRVNITVDGESYSIGVWVPSWAAGVSISAVMIILLQEKLGLHVVTGGGWATVNGFYAMAGCLTPNDIDDRGCGPKRTYYHIHLEGWTAGYAPTWNQIQADYPETAPLNVGSMGYQGLSGQYTSREVVENAYAAEGLALEFYRTHNTSWFQVFKYFDDISKIDASKSAKLCNETRLMESEAMETYAQFTGDWDGVDSSGPTGKLVGKCFSGHFWLAPSCRADPMQCYLFITAGPGYGYEHQMQRSTVFNMPTVIMVAKEWSDYTTLPLQVKSSFYWWQPDPTFLSLDARQILYDRYDAEAWRRGILLSDADFISIDKYASSDLEVVAPDALELVKAFKVDLNMINKLMAEREDSGDTPEAVACRWLQGNEELWEDWIPDPTTCYAQFGLYNEATQEFVQNRADPTNLKCRACDSGLHSSRLKDDLGVTHVCKPCALGTSQPSGASMQCDLCATGEYQDEPGSKSCKRCGKGTYQDTKGQDHCKECPAGTTTLGLGSVSVLECGCEIDSINIANESEGIECKPCSEGVFCPFSSSLDALKTGQAKLGEQYQVALRPGFWSKMKKPLEVFKCAPETFCPGGIPEVCNGGRVGIACAECPSGQSGVDECAACHPATVFMWWFFAILLFLGVTGFYWVTNPRVAAIATARQTWGVSIGLAVAWLQTLAISSLMTVEWPSTVSGSFSNLRVFVLDLDSLSFACFASEGGLSRYLLQVLVFPALIAWMIVAFFLSKALPKWLQWEPTKTINSIGGVMQVSFAIMSTVALQSMKCYGHPNGSYSLVKYPSITCGKGEQLAMMAAGLSLLIVFVVGFLAIVIYATIALPFWCARELNHRVRCFNFLTYRFRFDRWWFGIALLLRGPLISLVVTLATDHPAIQVCMNGLILTIYAVIQSTARPWKAPLLNWLDLSISILFIQIAFLSGFGIGIVKDFADVYGLLLVILFFCIIGVLVLAVGVAVLQEYCLKQEVKDSAILNVLESRSAGLDEKLLVFAKALVEQDYPLRHFLDRMNGHDLTHLETAINLISADLQLDFPVQSRRERTLMRLRESAVSARASVSRSASNAAPPGDPKVPPVQPQKDPEDLQVYSDEHTEDPQEVVSTEV